MAYLDLNQLTKKFGAVRAVDKFNLNVEKGELVCLLGPSGSGKSTILRMVGGFETPSDGEIVIDGEEVTYLAPEKRPTTMVFQSHALWTHMNVEQNVGFGLKLKGFGRAVVRQKSRESLELVGLGDLGQRRVDQLSGGQKQRVALARALVLEPKILLLDEPFASLDQHLRERLREEVRDIQQRLQITALFVTHGQDEALALADRIVVIRDGKIEQVASPTELYRRPETEFVAGFIGSMNFIDGEVKNGAFECQFLSVPAPIADGPARLAVRPEALKAVKTKDGPLSLHRVTDFGTHIELDIDAPNAKRLKSNVAPNEKHVVGGAIGLKTNEYAIYRDQNIAWRSIDEQK